MNKTFLLAVFLSATFFLSGCSLDTSITQSTGANLMPKATFIKTSDSGEIWEPKMKVDEKKSISSINVLAVAVDPFDPNIVYLGSEKNGIFVSRDGAETWSQIKFPEKVYGLALDHSARNVIYASGVFKGRGKIFKRTSEGSEWKEIYTEPADGTVISSLAMDKFNANVLYAGTNEGVIFKTTDGGNTWNNIHKAEAPVTSIAFDSANSNVVYFGVFQRSLLKTSNGGVSVENITSKISGLDGNQSVFSVTTDPRSAGTLYAGLGNGIAKSVNGGENWVNLNTLGSSRNFPVRVLAVNPQNSSELIYVAGKAIYKSTDGGVQWSTFQLDTAKDVGGIVYNRNNPSIIYAGLRNF
ncbi:MAG TPA: hypothetical protein DCX32_00630 [Candidatus Moranbacteria bacterium]|nr:MAG: hypothetical protein UW87_C0006G0026 [Candidatus Moranbacteria bacterium GW2011_GWC2_45_10]KKT95550.1 MAG: hypothetical protein UW95_C0001G0114 [Parcubacteria group bacterium GW2011_GWC1_45_14]HAV11043.1 hypothetical protein [Candidatus Moranbacteria bacterium]